MLDQDAKVLVLDTEEQVTKFRIFMQSAKFNFYYAHTLEDAIKIICDENIPVVLVGCRINGHLAEEIPGLIMKETNRSVHVMLNSFEADTCKFSRKSYVQSPLFDVIWPTTDPMKVEKRIIVALEAQKLEVSNGFIEGEDLC